MFGLRLIVKRECLTTDINDSGSMKINVEDLKTVVLPAAMYGAECWPATKEVERRLSVKETKMLRWTDGVTRMERIRNGVIRQKFGVAPTRCANLATMVRPRYAYKTADNWRIYEEAKRAAKKAVAVAKTSRYDEGNEKLERCDGERQFYRLAKARHRQSEAIEKFFGIDDENGHLLMNRKGAMERWHDYFERISMGEFAHPCPSRPSNAQSSANNHCGGNGSGFEEDEFL
ncbi:unnamed protein product [Heligmosomoides polygyrus]|uniref:Uncharacterized protein n=1 Tax=Heligmosomoides polygyrus TaxID=6339 RepID=A0A183G4Q2_HELPZ|nr:unnamed protein product [Heligmosomoides polygyrus]